MTWKEIVSAVAVIGGFFFLLFLFVRWVYREWKRIEAEEEELRQTGPRAASDERTLLLRRECGDELLLNDEAESLGSRVLRLLPLNSSADLAEAERVVDGGHFEALTPEVQHGDELLSGATEEVHGQRALLGAARHCLEAGGAGTKSDDRP